MIFKAAKKLDFLNRLVLVVNGLAALSLLISYLAPYINPASFWPVAFFSLAYTFLLFINCIFVIYWLLSIRLYALLSGICILLGAHLMLLQIGLHQSDFSDKKASPNYIRMMTYNVHVFESDNDDSDIKPQVLQIIREKQPDIINLQEYFTRISDHGLMADSIKKTLGSGYYYFNSFSATVYDSTGLAIFSRYPIIHHDTIPATVKGIRTEGFFADVMRQGKMLRIYCVHLQSTHFDIDDNTYLSSLQRAKGKLSLNKSKLIGIKLKWAFIIRSQQIKALKKHMNDCPYPYILTGDFNDTPLSYSVTQLSNGINNAFAEKGMGLGITFYGDFPGFQIDYIMASKQFNVVNYHIEKKKLSDHYPVFSDLELVNK